MLLSNWQAGDQRQAAASQLDSEFIGLSDIVALFRQYAWSIVACILVGALAAWIYGKDAAPTFTARTQILIEPRLPQFLLQESGAVSTALDTAQIESQITVMRSEKIAKLVIDDLGLMDNPAFMRLTKPSVADRLRALAATLVALVGARRPAWLRADAPDGATDPSRVALPDAGDAEESEESEESLSDFEVGRMAIWRFESSLDVRRVGVGYAVDIYASSPDPDLAAEIANATADNFIREQVDSKAASAREGGEWMERRLGELRRQMNTATQIAQEFRARHDYRVRPPGAEVVNGQLIYNRDAGDNPEGPTLEELELTADTYRKMYESFLQAYTSNLSQQSYLVADARVITSATRPLTPTHPRKKLVLIFGIFAGSIAGTGLAFLRNTLDRSVRTPRQVREELALECIGELPAVRGRNGGFGRPDEVALSPSSAFREALGQAKSAIGLGGMQGRSRMIGVVSALPGEGKSTCASNLALLYGMDGLSTLLVDADPEHATTTRRLAAPALAAGACGPGETVAARIVPMAGGRADLLPAQVSAAQRVFTPGGLDALRPVLDGYDAVILDLPPATSGAEKLAISGGLDGVIIVVEWGETPVDVVRGLVRILRANGAPIIGVLLSRVRILSSKPYRRTRVRQPR